MALGEGTEGLLLDGQDQTGCPTRDLDCARHCIGWLVQLLFESWRTAEIDQSRVSSDPRL